MMNERLKAPAPVAARGRGHNKTHQHSTPRRQYSASPADLLLPLLEKVRGKGPGQWMACCPAHEDHTPSLSVRECGDGVLLLHCFSGECGAAEVLHAVGLELKDLFPQRMQAQKPKRRYERRISPLDALQALDYEALFVATVASDMLRYREVGRATMDRLAVAVSRIGAARELYR